MYTGVTEAQKEITCVTYVLENSLHKPNLAQTGAFPPNKSAGLSGPGM